VASFKQPCAQDAALGFARQVHAPMPIAWQRSSRGCRAGSRWPGALWPSEPWRLVLSTYPGKAEAMPMPWASMPWPRRRRSLSDLAGAGYAVAAR
jgi:cobaltochelatase CobN